MIDLDQRELRLRHRLADIRDSYAYTLIDCPPALDLLTLNALLAADSILVPIQCEFFALEGVSELMDTVDRIRDVFHHPIKIEGILLTMYDDRTNLTRQVAKDLREFFGTEVLPDDYSTQCTPGRSPELRQTDSSLRRPLTGSRELYPASKGDTGQ